MKAIKKFEELVKNGVVKMQSPDKSRAEFLVREAEQSYAYLLELVIKIGVTELNANDYVKKCYDIIMGIVRAEMLLKGYNASGYGAHEAEVSYLRVLGFNEVDVQFADQMRYFRNGMMYYGTILDKEYAQKVLDFFNQVYPRLRKIASPIK